MHRRKSSTPAISTTTTSSPLPLLDGRVGDRSSTSRPESVFDHHQPPMTSMKTAFFADRAGNNDYSQTDESSSTGATSTVAWCGALVLSSVLLTNLLKWLFRLQQQQLGGACELFVTVVQLALTWTLLHPATTRLVRGRLAAWGCCPRPRSGRHLPRGLPLVSEYRVPATTIGRSRPGLGGDQFADWSPTIRRRSRSETDTPHSPMLGGKAGGWSTEGYVQELYERDAEGRRTRLLGMALGTVTALEFGMNSMSLHRISVSLCTVAKAVNPLMTYALLLVMGFENAVQWRLVGALGLILCGICLTVKELRLGWDEVPGLALVILSCSMGSIRSVLTQHMSAGRKQKIPPLRLIQQSYPYAVVNLLPLALVRDVWPLLSQARPIPTATPGLPDFLEDSGISPTNSGISPPNTNSITPDNPPLSVADPAWAQIVSLWIVTTACGVLLALSLVETTRRIGALSVMVLGQARNCFTIFLAVALFGDQWTAKAMMATLLLAAGLVLYSVETRRAQAAKAHNKSGSSL